MLDELHDLNGVVLSWLETPSVEDFGTSEILNGAENFQLWFDGEVRKWNFGFGQNWKSEHPDSTTFTFDLTNYRVKTHQDAIELLRSEDWLAVLHRLADTLAGMHAANDECIEWMESRVGSPEEEAEEMYPFLALVVKRQDDGGWDVSFSFDLDRDVDESDVAYVSWPHLMGARTRADVVTLLKSDTWRSEINGRAQQYASADYSLAGSLERLKPADEVEPCFDENNADTADGRRRMPLADINEEFFSAAELDDALRAAHEVTTWHLQSHASKAGDEIYDDNLGVYVWAAKMSGGFAIRVQVADRDHASVHTPDDSKWMGFQGLWTLREVNSDFQSEERRQAFLALGQEHFHESFMDRSVH